VANRNGQRLHDQSGLFTESLAKTNWTWNLLSRSAVFQQEKEHDQIHDHRLNPPVKQVIHVQGCTGARGENRTRNEPPDALSERAKSAVSDESSGFYRPVSRSVSRPKRAKISTVERGYRTAVLDPKLSLGSRLRVLDGLARLSRPSYS
jgi:hypothetical protein